MRTYTFLPEFHPSFNKNPKHNREKKQTTRDRNENPSDIYILESPQFPHIDNVI